MKKDKSSQLLSLDLVERTEDLQPDGQKDKSVSVKWLLLMALFLWTKTKMGWFLLEYSVSGTDNATQKSHWRPSFLYFGKFKNNIVSWNLLHIHCFFSLSCNSCFLNHVSAQSFDWTVQPSQTCWVFQKYPLVHKYLCICGCFSCYIGCFMALFTSIFWCIYCFTGSSD